MCAQVEIYVILLVTAATQTIIQGDSADMCSSNIITLEATGNDESSQSLTSPNYPEYYPSNQFCRWVIKAAESYQVVRVRVVESHITISANCNSDYLTIQDGDGLYAFTMRNCCGTSCEGDVVTSTGQSMRISFRSNVKSSNKGFKIEYWTVPKTSKEIKAPVWGAVNYFLFTLFGIIASSIAMGMIVVGFGPKESRENRPKLTCDRATLKPIAGLILCVSLCIIILPIFIYAVYVS